MSLLSRFSIGVAPVAFSLSGGFILDDARDAVIQSLFPSCDLGFGCSIGGRLVPRCIGFNTRLFIELGLMALGTPFVSGCGHLQTLFFPSKSCRFCGCLCCTVGVKESSFGIGSGATAVGKIVVLGLSHDVFRQIGLGPPSARVRHNRELANIQQLVAARAP
ncbi:hypothetical protein C8D95_11539 [Silicimonas algicola]|uniref:Uncharacterized protein n=1 Tax=Silicimonas algicola TaxID=1826607 RepID=A0A316FWP9_9RHOB|nr:hypothetical protein C8D95_11539 [Silicimonas algicola]